MLPAHAAGACTAQSCNADDLDGWLARRGSDNRIRVDEGPRAFERMAGPQHQRVATVAASSTSIMGCCGSGVAGGVLTLAGVGAGTASEIAGWSTPVQALFIVGFVLNWLRLRGKLGVVGGR